MPILGREFLNCDDNVPYFRSINDFLTLQGNIMSQGKLLHYGPLLVSEGDCGSSFRGRELVVFLFEQRIIFSECQKKRTAFSSEEYFCKSHLQVSQTGLFNNTPLSHTRSMVCEYTVYIDAYMTEQRINHFVNFFRRLEGSRAFVIRVG